MGKKKNKNTNKENIVVVAPTEGTSSTPAAALPVEKAMMGPIEPPARIEDTVTANIDTEEIERAFAASGFKKEVDDDSDD